MAALPTAERRIFSPGRESPVHSGLRIISPERRERETSWWQNTVVYQIYPSSFHDSNRDGVGDLEGITQKLNYLQDLGVGTIWLSPIYQSPMNDGGYDVANYMGIDPRFGTMDDFRTLVGESHARNIRVTMDLVMNHSSSENPWFQEAASSRDNPKRDWYIWADPKADGSPPNNWPSFFDGSPGSAWTYSQETGQYYLHKFDETQPDLNMRNPEVRQAMKDAMRFWLEEGVDGFRMDVLDHIFEDPTFADMELNASYDGDNPLEKVRWREKYFQFPEVYEWTEEVMELLHTYDAVGIGEIGGSYDTQHVVRLHEAGLDLPFNFRLLDTPFEASAIRNEVETYISSLPPDAWPNFVWGNHDNPRLANRIGNENMSIATMMLLALPGTPFVYNGDEIGMENGVITEEQNKDPQGKRMGLKWSRDPERTPMQWNRAKNAGFSESDSPWLPSGDAQNGRNVLDQMQDPNSLLNLTKDLLSARAENPALRHGEYTSLSIESDNIYAFGRDSGDQQIIVVINFSNEQQVLPMPEGVTGTVLLSTERSDEGHSLSKEIVLEPKQGYIVDLTPENNVIMMRRNAPPDYAELALAS